MAGTHQHPPGAVFIPVHRPDDRADVAANCLFFIIAGPVATSPLIAAAFHLPCQHPAHRAALQADPVRGPPAVEEMLRDVSPTAFAGTDRADVEVESERFQAGSRFGATRHPQRHPGAARTPATSPGLRTR